MAVKIDSSSHGHEDLDRYRDIRKGIYAEISVCRREMDEALGDMSWVLDEQWIERIVLAATGVPPGCAVMPDFRNRLIVIAAVTVAAIEMHDREIAKGA